MATTGEPYGLFWDSQNGDRTYSAASFEYWLKKFFTSGVFNGDMQVKATSGMTLEIEPGYANVDGKVKFWNGAFNLTLNPANSTYPRIDTIVITRDNVNREITCEVVTGSYSADTPQPTAPIRNAEIYQLVLAQIYVGTGVTEITQSSITDTRPDNSLCGWITGTVTQLDFSQFTAQFEAYFAEFKADAEGDYAAWFNNVQQEQIEDKEAWDAWYAALQEELHELPPDSAEYLQVEIDELKESGLSGSIFKITTINSSLEGKSVSITNADGTEVKTGTFDSNLECMIYGMKSVGELTITSTDGIQTATSVVSIPYFGNYVVPIAFWAATVNIQGDENLYGATITVKDSDNLTVGTVTLSAIDGTGTFIATKADTYTFNFTYQSVAYSQELAVTQETTYSLSLSAGFDWQTWVDTARFLDASDYANLGEVLADEEAVRELCLEHNCVDYLCDISSVNNDLETIINDDLFAKWVNNSDYALDNMIANAAIKDAMDEADKYGYGEWVIIDDTTTPPTWGAKGNVPIMTSSSAPYGEVITSGTYGSSNPAYYAFDGSDSTHYASNNDNNDKWIGYAFTNPVCVKKCKIRFYNLTGLESVKVQGYDGSAWNDIGSANVTDVNTEIECTNTSYYLRYRVLRTNSNTYSLTAVSLQFYGRELSVSVPVMTSNTTPYGEASNSDPNAVTVPAWKAFDGVSDASNARNYAQCTLEERLIYKFNNKVKCMMVYHEQNYDGGTWYVTKAEIQASNDGVNFTKIADMNMTPADNGKTYLSLNNSDGYKYWAFYAKSDGASSGVISEGVCGVAELQFYCEDYSEKEFEVGTTRKWLYDHGVELETITISGTGTKGADAIQLTAANAQAVATIDTTDYSLMRGKVGSHASGTNQLLCGSGVSNFTANNMPYNNGFDVSSVNGSNSVGVKQTANGIFDATEIWLE